MVERTITMADVVSAVEQGRVSRGGWRGGVGYHGNIASDKISKGHM